MCLGKPELRDPGGKGEHGSAYELRLWSQTTRQRSSPSSTPSWLNELGQGLLGFSPFTYTNLTELGQEALSTEEELGICDKMPNKS